MLRRFFFVLVALPLLLGSRPAAAQSVEEIVARNLEARGGPERLRALTSVRMTGRIQYDDGSQAPFVLEVGRPGRMRMELTVRGVRQIRTWDGRRGFVSTAGSVRAMNAEEAATAAQQADLDGALIDWAAKGHRVEAMGQEPVDGGTAWVLKVTRADGDVRYHSIDRKTGLEVRQVGTRVIGGETYEFESLLREYHDVEGLEFPFAIETGPVDGTPRETLYVDRLELNPVLDDGRFVVPRRGVPGRTRR